MNHEQQQQLLERYLAGQCTARERIQVEEAYRLMATNVRTSVTDTQRERNKALVRMYLKQYLASNDAVVANPKRTERQWLRSWRAMAASVLLLVGVGLAWLYWPQHSDLPPGGNRATLTLTDGTRIALSPEQAGVSVGATGVTYLDGSQIAEISGHGLMGSAEGQELVLETPIGGQYRLRLPDGTDVWLNAGSTLRYPTHFSARGDRVVELLGEAYFDVRSHASQSFVVRSGNHQVRVLGTRFMVSAYRDEPAVRTVLAEGAVVVAAGGSQVILAPDQQTRWYGQGLQQEPVDAAAAMAWMAGEFVFDKEPLEVIMRQLARWYGVEVLFVDEQARAEEFVGIVGRFEQIDQVLRKLEQTGNVKFRRTDKQVQVHYRSKK